MLSFWYNSWIILVLYKISGLSQEQHQKRSAKEEFTRFEIVWPRLYNKETQVFSTRLKNEHLDNLNLLLPIGDKDLLIELHLNKNLFGSTYVEKDVTSRGHVIHKPSDHNTTRHCYYHGNIKDQPSSIAAISTCDGISGTIFLEDDVFHLEPQESVIDGEHILFRDSNKIITNYSCGTQDQQGLPNFPSLLRPKQKDKLKRSIYWPYDSDTDTKVVELYVVNDKLQYINHGSDADRVMIRTKEIVNIASSLYKEVNIYLALVGIEVWTNRNPIEIVENADTTMNNFLEYRRSYISPLHKNDNTQLFTGYKLDVVGKAPIRTICTWQYSGAVNVDDSALVGSVATRVVHQLGHNFGLTHDLDTCTCEDSICIMNSNFGGNHPKHWSSCSLEQFSEIFNQGMDYCLHDLPASLYRGPVCGNRFVEDGEQCDCGTVESCDNNCCNASTCALFSNATCATGKCCDLNTCQFKPAATLCRESSDTCDLAEYCHGNTEHCPTDDHKKNGMECEVLGTESYCYNGQCRSRQSQCQKLWGETGEDSIHTCYDYFNVMGLANGHCGFDWLNKEFTKCKKEDVMCGMLHCSHCAEKLVFWKEALSYTMPEGWVMVNGERHECYGAILDVGLDYEDPGMVPEGAKCAENKLCLNKQCQPLSALPVVTCPDEGNCSNHGVCTNMGHCYCDVGYGSHDCNETGNGGSQHSGPIQMDQCAEGFYGINCSYFCSVNCEKPCDQFSTTGSCGGFCKPGFTGDNCTTECAEGFYGMNCSYPCSVNCAKPCDKFSTTGSCGGLCKPGFIGDICTTECDDGTYGDNCSHNCSEFCAEACDKFSESGSCGYNCLSGYAGNNCTEECMQGFFGRNCSSSCSLNCEKPCDKFSTTGSCGGLCKPGFIGDNCTTACEPGSYGTNCYYTCFGNCKGPCEITNGVCRHGCNEGWTGRFCDIEIPSNEVVATDNSPPTIVSFFSIFLIMTMMAAMHISV